VERGKCVCVCVCVCVGRGGGVVRRGAAAPPCLVLWVLTSGHKGHAEREESTVFHFLPPRAAPRTKIPRERKWWSRVTGSGGAQRKSEGWFGWRARGDLNKDLKCLKLLRGTFIPCCLWRPLWTKVVMSPSTRVPLENLSFHCSGGLRVCPVKSWSRGEYLLLEEEEEEQSSPSPPTGTSACGPRLQQSFIWV